MKSISKFSGAVLLGVFLLTTTEGAFSYCIFTNSAGLYRKYIDNDIPFIYRLHTSTPDSYLTRIDMAADQWTTVAASYWVFQRGPSTTVSAAVQDGVNLVYFDIAGDNFTPGTNVIAFSRTYTTTVGGFRAVESDLVWNARDFPPSPSGLPGRQDLQSVMAHEFGHHLGLGHQGTPGSPPGCGPTIPAAVMYGLSASGDTSKRHLHIHDLAGLASIYPSWILQGNITDAFSSQPISGAEIAFMGTHATWIGPVESPQPSRFQRPGLVLSSIFSNSAGAYGTIVLDQTFQVIVNAFGYRPDTATITFNPPGGIGQTQVITHSVALQPTVVAQFSGTVHDSASGNPIEGVILTFYWMNDLSGQSIASTQTNSAGQFNLQLPTEESYAIVISPPMPYPDTLWRENIFHLPSGTTIQFPVNAAKILLVDDASGQPYASFYHGAFDEIGISRRTWETTVQGVPTLSDVALFPEPRTIFWFTGNDTSSALTPAERSFLIAHLNNSGKLLLTGQNIAEYSVSADTLLTAYFGVAFLQNATGFAANTVRGYPGDIIGDGLVISLLGGAANQQSKDQLILTGSPFGQVHKVLHYGTDTVRIAGVRTEDANRRYKAVFLAFGVEGIGNLISRAALVERVWNYLADTTFTVGIDEILTGKVPIDFIVEQNYPNPFNPSTTIRVGVPEKAIVTVRIFNALGQEVSRLFDGELAAGHYEFLWDGRSAMGTNVSSGLYFFRVEATGATGVVHTSTRKMLMLK